MAKKKVKYTFDYDSKFLNEHNFQNIDFIQNNSIEVEDKIICGTRGWSLNNERTEQEKKLIDREALRLELSIKSALDLNSDKEIIVFMHYPPVIRQNIDNEFMRVLRKYNIKKCFYAHLHGKSIEDAVEGNIYGIDFKLISADALDFKLMKI